MHQAERERVCFRENSPSLHGGDDGRSQPGSQKLRLPLTVRAHHAASRVNHGPPGGLEQLGDFIERALIGGRRGGRPFELGFYDHPLFFRLKQVRLHHHLRRTGPSRRRPAKRGFHGGRDPRDGIGRERLFDAACERLFHIHVVDGASVPHIVGERGRHRDHGYGVLESGAKRGGDVRAARSRHGENHARLA